MVRNDERAMPGDGLAATAIAVLGAGRWGANIVRDLAGLGVAVVAVDPDPQARDRAIALGAISAHGGFGDLPPVDGVIVATPASGHEHDVLLAGTLDVPIACEKPLAVSSRSAGVIVDAVGERLTVLHVWRYHPGVELLGELARSGTLGEITAVRTTRTNWASPRTDVDPVWTLLAHDLSIAVELLGHVPQPVEATVERIAGRAVSLWGTFGSSPSLVVETSSRSDERRRDVRVHGTEGVAVLHDGADAVQVLTGTSPEPVVERLGFDPTPALTRELAAFVDHVRGGPAPKTDADEGRTVVEAIDRALGLAER